MRPAANTCTTSAASDGETLSDCFTNYFVMSQQVGTRFWLNADGHRARGLLLQQLPADRIKDDDDRAESWRGLTALAGTLTASAYGRVLQTFCSRKLRTTTAKKVGRIMQRNHPAPSLSRGSRAAV